jgi:phage shock protein E
MSRTRLALLVTPLALLALAACTQRHEGGATAATGSPISVADLAQRVEAGDAPVVLDVRTPAEFDQGHVPGAINIPYDQLASRLDELPAGSGDEVVVHCERGGRAAKAERVLNDAGYTDVRDLEGHFQAWQAAGLPVEK